MNPGYEEKLYLLPFDQRDPYIAGMFDFELPLSARQHAQVRETKQLIYEGFKLAMQAGVPSDVSGVLVDEEFGADILRDARRCGFVTALPTEQSGSDEFEFEYGADFPHHIETFDPTFVHALVRYNPDGDAALNQRQSERLRRLSDYCCRSGPRFMLELLVPATKSQMEQVDDDEDAYDWEARPLMMQQSIRALQDSGVEPDVWKIEGLERREECERMIQTVQRDGRNAVRCIVLGCSADESKVRGWLAAAASVAGFIGFAVGRTSFWDVVAGYRAQTLTRAEAVVRIAQRLREWVDIFEQGLLARTARPDRLTEGAP